MVDADDLWAVLVVVCEGVRWAVLVVACEGVR